MDRKFVAIAAVFFALGALLGALSIQRVDASPLLGSGAPTVVSYQGVISDGGAAYDGTGYFKFAIVNAAGDTTYWSNDGTSTGGGEPAAYVTMNVNNGYFMALLGDTNVTNMNALPASVFSGTERYLRIWFSSGSIVMTQLSPDQRFTAAPYALQAQEAADADTLDGVDSTELYTKAEVDALLVAYDNRINALETKLASVSVEDGGNDVVFTDVNVHIRSGSGATYGAVNGRGNLIVGYNENGGGAVRIGSHNVIVGPFHSYSSYGGFVVGWANVISGENAAVVGGYHNEATGDYASVNGGSYNIASGEKSSVSGGSANTASGEKASVTGGSGNTANDIGSSVTGGLSNLASGMWSSVSGGGNNTASNSYSSITGGRYNTSRGQYSAVMGGGGPSSTEGNDAFAHFSVVVGGQSNTAGDLAGLDWDLGFASVILGGYGNNTIADWASISGGSSNIASGDYASVSGGVDNEAGGQNSTIGGGANGTVTGGADWLAGVLFQDN
ncbi:MAG: hypothetical protein PVF85_14385 [Anaerolineales bacterium]|jgi:hypothetical protein